MKYGIPTSKVKSSLGNFLGKKKNDIFIFQLQGRLGNQIWGLSDAYLLHKILGKKVLLDLGDCHIDEENSDFYAFISNLSWLDAIFLESESSNRITEVKKLQFEDFSMPNSSLGYRGFSARYSCLKDSGLFTEGQLPDFILESKKTSSQKFISFSIRRGDYWQNPHLGILPISYYKKALALIDDYEKDLPILLFGEGNFKYFKRNFPRKIWSRISVVATPQSPIQDLEKLSHARYSVIANSTFSFLGAYFSQSKTIFTPNPFYLAVEGWNDNLRNTRSCDILFSKAPNMRFLKLRIQKKIREYV